MPRFLRGVGFTPADPHRIYSADGPYWDTPWGTTEKHA